MTEAIKKVAAFAVAIVFACGCLLVPGTELVDEVQAADGISGDCAEGEVIVGYVDTDDMDLTAGEERKVDSLLGDSEELIALDDTSLADVDIDESRLTGEVQKDEEVDETLAVVSSEDKSTEELISEIEKLPNVDFVEPNYRLKLYEGEAAEETAATDEALEEEVSAETGETASDADADAQAEEEAVTQEDTETQTTAETQAEETAGEAGHAEAEMTLAGQIDTDLTSQQWAYYGGSGASDYRMFIGGWNGTSQNAQDTVVAVVDSGVNYQHPDLDEVMWNKGKSIPSLASRGGTYGINVSGSGSVENIMDENGHGTHCAGIIAAEWNNGGVAGAANGTRIMAVKVAGPNGFYVSNIIKAYDYIKTAKSARVNIVAINNSWGFTEPQTDSLGVAKAVQEAGGLNMVSVFASGNEGKNCDISYSGKHYLCYFLQDLSCTVIVNNIEKDGSLNYTSNYGAASTDIGAPGTCILSTVPGSDAKAAKFDRMDGTSMAAPAVTGEVAIISSEMPSASASEIAGVVKKKENTNQCSSLQGKCKSGGVANVSKALADGSKKIRYKKITLSSRERVYNGKSTKPDVNVKGLVRGRDYTVKYVGGFFNAGTYKVVVEGMGDYVGSVEYSYKITKATPKVSLSYATFYYNGSYRYNKVSVYGASGSAWGKNVDYKLGGDISAKSPGKHSVTVYPVKSQNYYNVTKSYKIVIRPTGIAKLTAARGGFTVRATGQSSNYVSGYQVRYSKYSSMSGATMKTIGTSCSSTSKKITKLKRNTVYYVQVRTYKMIGGTKYISDWSSKKYVKTK